MDSLRNEQTVEGVAMKSGQLVNVERMAKVHGKHPDGVAGEVIVEVCDEVPGCAQLSHTRLYSDLPATGRAKE